MRTARRGASNARTAAINHLKALLVTAPAPVRETLDGRPVSVLITNCARLRPDETGLTDPAHASKAALQAIAHRIQLLEAEITMADQRLAKLVGRGAGRARGSLLAEFLKSPSAGTYLYVGLIEEAVKLAALWLLVAVAATAAWRSSRPRRACACADRRRRSPQQSPPP